MGNTGTKDESTSNHERGTTNLFNQIEIQLLLRHENSVEQIIQLSKNKIASVDDHGKIFVWNIDTGTFLFEFHCSGFAGLQSVAASNSKSNKSEIKHNLLVVPDDKKNYLVSSFLTTICIWDIETGHTVSVNDGYHQHPIRALSLISHAKPEQNKALFCSASTDEEIIIWDAEGNFLSKIMKTYSIGTIENVLYLKFNRQILLTYKNSNQLSSYNYEKNQHQKYTLPHSHPICSLTVLRKSSFAVGFTDGTVIIIEYNDADEFHYNTVKYKSPSSVKLVAVNKKYLAIISTSTYVIYSVKAHKEILIKDTTSPVVGLIPLYKGTRLVVCFEDGSFQLLAPKDEPNLPAVFADKKVRRKITQEYNECGSINVNSNPINYIIPLSLYSFASCSADGLILLWKDSRVQSELRNKIASDSIDFHQKPNSHKQSDVKKLDA